MEVRVLSIPSRVQHNGCAFDLGSKDCGFKSCHSENWVVQWQCGGLQNLKYRFNSYPRLWQVAERLNAVVLKTIIREYRGFESHPAQSLLSSMVEQQFCKLLVIGSSPIEGKRVQFNGRTVVFKIINVGSIPTTRVKYLKIYTRQFRAKYWLNIFYCKLI